MKSRIPDLDIISSDKKSAIDIIEVVLSSLRGDETWLQIKKKFDNWNVKAYLLNDNCYGLFVEGYIISKYSIEFPVLDKKIYRILKFVGDYCIHEVSRNLKKSDKYKFVIIKLHKVVI